MLRSAWQPVRACTIAPTASFFASRPAATSLLASACCCSPPARAHFATAAKSSVVVFDTALKRAQRRRAALSPDFASYHYLRDEIAERMVDRLADINRAFPVAVEIGCGTGAHISSRIHQVASQQAHAESEALARAAAAAAPVAAANAAATASSSSGMQPLGSTPVAQPTVSVPGRGQIRTLHLCDSCPEALQRTREYWEQHASSKPSTRTHEYHVVDEEGSLPFAPASVDLIISSLSMHWINDLPGFLRRCRTALKPDGVFLAAMIGGATLQEMRSAFTVADLERLGGVQAHVSPFAYGRDCGDLMASAGFNMPTVDTDVLTLRYPDLFTLASHLQGMGESNAAVLRPKSVSRDVFLSAAATYESLYADSDGLLPATVQVFYMIGWAPAASQPKPMERGSATHKIGDIGALAAASSTTASEQAKPSSAEEQAAPLQE